MSTVPPHRPPEQRRTASGRDVEGGFTLLEVLIAVAVLAIGLVALLGLHASSIALVGEDLRLTEATLLAQTLMARAESEGPPEFGETSGDFEDWYPGRYGGFRWERQVLPTIAQRLREVRVTVLWDDDRRQCQLIEYMREPPQ